MRVIEARWGRLHNLGMAVVAIALAAVALANLARGAQGAPVGTGDPRFMLYLLLAAAMAYYAWLGLNRFGNRAPQVTIDRDGIVLGFGRDRRLAWHDIEWVRLRRLGVRPTLQIGLVPEAFVIANLRLSLWSLDDGLRPIRGVTSAVAVRDNGLDTRTTMMLDAIKAFRPNLVRP
jgi:hypothetical protein